MRDVSRLSPTGWWRAETYAKPFDWATEPSLALEAKRFWTARRGRRRAVVIRNMVVDLESAFEASHVTDQILISSAMSTILRQTARLVRPPASSRARRPADRIPTGRALARLLVDRRCAQRCAAPLLPAVLIPNTPADVVQELYLKELKAFKPTPAVRPHLVLGFTRITFVADQGRPRWACEDILRTHRASGARTADRPCLRIGRVRCV